MIPIKREIDRITVEMSQIEHYTGVEKDDNPELPKRHEYLNTRREVLIRRLALC
jgi:hypothetical protein